MDLAQGQKNIDTRIFETETEFHFCQGPTEVSDLISVRGSLEL